jgi:hypothetical protein
MDDFGDFDKKHPISRNIAILVTSVLPEHEIKKHMDRRRTERDLSVKDKTTFYTFPHHLPSLGVKNLPTVQHVLELYSLDPKSSSRRVPIRLSSVHSIDKSYSSSKNITKMNTSHAYEEIKYYR